MTTVNTNARAVDFGEVDVKSEDPFSEVRKITDLYEKDSTLLLFDARHAAYRAIHTREGLTAPDGSDTRGLHGFLEIVSTACSVFRTTRFLIVWDGGVENKRKVHPHYKSRQDRPSTPEEVEAHEATRAAMKVTREGTDKIGMPKVHHSEFEADDLIGLASRIESTHHRTVIVSDDKDFYQLITPLCSIWRGISKRIVGPAEFASEFPFTPSQYVDYKALVGEPDTGDNIPGVPGFGPKTAAKYIGSHGSLDAAIAFAVSSASRTKPKPYAVDVALASNQPAAHLSRRLSKISTTASDLAGWSMPRTAKAVEGMLRLAVDTLSLPHGRSYDKAARVLQGFYGFSSETCEQCLRPMGYE